MKTKGFTLIELMFFIAVAVILFIIGSSVFAPKPSGSQPVQAERNDEAQSVNPDFTTKCYNGVLYFTTRNTGSGKEYPTTPVISISPNPDRLRPTTCK